MSGQNVSYHRWTPRDAVEEQRCRNCGILRAPALLDGLNFAPVVAFSLDGGKSWQRDRPTCPPGRP